jgi:hypothetical protein
VRLSKKGGLSWSSSSRVVITDEYPMANTEFQQICKHLAINDPVTAAQLFGLSWRTCQRYWYGELVIPGPLARLLRVIVHSGISVAKLRAFSAPIVPRDNSTKEPDQTMVPSTRRRNHGQERLGGTPHRTRRGIPSSD